MVGARRQRRRGRTDGRTDEEEARNGMNVNDNDGAKEASATLFCRFSPPSFLLAFGWFAQSGSKKGFFVWYN